jgi:hypothetical protein
MAMHESGRGEALRLRKLQNRMAKNAVPLRRFVQKDSRRRAIMRVREEPR